MKGKPVPGKGGSTPKPKRRRGKDSSKVKPKLLTAYNIFQKIVHEDMYGKLGGSEGLVSSLRVNHQISTKVCT